MSTGELRDPLRFVQARNVELQAENKALQEEVDGLRNILHILFSLQEVAGTITERTDVLNLLDRILQMAMESINAEDGSLLLVDPDAKELVFVVVHGQIREALVGHRLPLGHGIAGWVAEHGEPVRVRDVSLDSRFSPDVDQEYNFHTRSLLCVPLISGDRVLGVIQALNKVDGEQFIDLELTLLGIVAQLAAAAIYRAETAVTPEPA
ncbi:MAG: GAF domain-containing protein [Chloroflexota bacterium]|nr:GAF domain-containing protein [Anaerolineales bacterium]MCB8967952.1 GAF domain-containing protein [Ardenticatenaceae bacterium]